jgi:hypothetical protein
MAVEAYAYLHLLERYRRFWTVLMRLMEVGRLPLARTEVRLLDVGAGPAPVTYATIDFYQALHAYGTEQQAENPAGAAIWTHRVPGPTMAGQAWDLPIMAGDESPLIITARASLAPLHPTGAGPYG